MKAALIIFLTFILASSNQATAQFNPINKKIKVLFIGNSYTTANDLPDLIENMANASGNSLDFARYAPGGYSLQDHSRDPLTLELINQQQWDYVVLQEQSQKPALDDIYTDENVIPYLLKLDSIIKKNNPCTQVILFETWARRNGDQEYCHSYPSTCNFESMQKRIKESYKRMADISKAVIAPVGEAFRYMMEYDSSVVLYQDDNSQPTIEGSYLAAVVFHEVFFHRDSYGNDFYNNFSQSKAVHLQLAAKKAVTDNLNYWNFGINEPWATFNWHQSDATGLTVFESVSDSAFKHFWDFGDNSTSTEANPVHQYNNSQYYPVMHSVCDTCRCDTFWLVNNIIVYTSAIAETTPANSLKVFPAMVKNGTLWIVTKGMHSGDPSIFSSDGRNISIAADVTDEGFKADVSPLVPGMYFIKVDFNGKNYFARFEKQ
jgi:hypothetical protein